MNEFTLRNGLRVVYEKIPYVRTVAVGVWVGGGARAEQTNESGISHYIEHMLFKGTERRSAKDIAAETDCVGGNLNAYTAREYTCFYANAIDEHLELLFDILSDMYCCSRLDDGDIERERSVILEEIRMYEDSPEDAAMELLSRTAWGDSGLGRSITGTASTVERISGAQLRAFVAKHHNAQNTVLSVAGNFDVQQLTELAQRYFDRVPQGAPMQASPQVDFLSNSAASEKDIEQSHLCLAYPGMGHTDPLRYAMAVFCNAFGGNMSSRLFQKIREDRGLAYSVYTTTESYSDTGMLTIYAGLSPENTDVVRDLILRESEGLLQHGLTETELRRCIGQLRGNYVMSLESVGGHMSSLGRHAILGLPQQMPDEILKEIETVRAEHVTAVIQKVLGGGKAEALVRPYGKDRIC